MGQTLSRAPPVCWVNQRVSPPPGLARVTAGPDADGAAAATQGLLALVLQSFKDRGRTGGRGRCDRVDKRAADDERGVEAARQALHAARCIDGVADHRERQAVLA